MRLHHLTSQLLVIDTQQRLLPHVVEPDETAATIMRLVRYAARLGVPLTIAEHCPKAIGSTLAPLLAVAAEAAGDVVRLEKSTYSCWSEPTLAERTKSLARARRRQIVVAGLEAHVCVLQTALDLLANDLDVYLVADATSSRRAEDRTLACERLRQAGAAIVTSEMVAFEWLERAGTPEFKDLIALIRDRR